MCLKNVLCKSLVYLGISLLRYQWVFRVLLSEFFSEWYDFICLYAIEVLQYWCTMKRGTQRKVHKDILLPHILITEYKKWKFTETVVCLQIIFLVLTSPIYCKILKQPRQYLFKRSSCFHHDSPVSMCPLCDTINQLLFATILFRDLPVMNWFAASNFRDWHYL